MTVRGWSMVRAQVVPYILGYAGVFGMLGIGAFVGAIYGILFGVLSVYIFLPLYAALCYFLFRRYSHSAGVKLAQIEASKYL